MSSEQSEARMREICREEIDRLRTEVQRELRKKLEDMAARLSAGEFQALLASLAESARPSMVDRKHTHPEIIKEIGELHRHLIRAILDLSKGLTGPAESGTTDWSEEPEIDAQSTQAY